MRQDVVRLIAIVALLVSGSAAHAATAQFLSTGDLLAAYDQGDPMSRRVILLGLAQIESGIALANADLRAKGAAPLYCVPSQQMLTGEQILEMLRRYSAAHPEIAPGSYAVGILRAAEDLFPCR